jgi:hypothetical protein
MNVETKVIKSSLGLLNLAEELGNVSLACKYLGYSRDTFYRYKDLLSEGGEEALRDMNRKKPNIQNRIEAQIETRVVSFAIEHPAFGQTRASNELKKEGIFISPAGVRCVWLRHDLATFQKRLKALEAKVAQEGLILTESQVAALEKAKEEKVAHGEIETHHPGYLGAQDTYYVGYIKGVGKIYQQTFIDTYSKVATVKLYDRKIALVAADMLNDRVIPMYDQYCIILMKNFLIVFYINLPKILLEMKKLHKSFLHAIINIGYIIYLKQALVLVIMIYFLQIFLIGIRKLII